MKEFDELKEKLRELGGILLKLLQGLWKKGDQSLSRVIPNSTARLVLIIALASFLGGAVFSSMVSGLKGGKREFSVPGGSLLRYIFAPTMKVAGEQEDGQFIFSNFESTDDLKVWSLQSARLEISPNHQAEGVNSGKITFFGDVEASAITIEDYFESRKGLDDWSDYDSLAFEIYNPLSEKQRLIIQVKDEEGNRFKSNLFVSAKTLQPFQFSMKKMDRMLDLKRIRQISIFIWEPRIDLEFFVDNLRLIPREFTEEAETESRDDNKFPKAPPVKSRPLNLLDYGFQYRKAAWLVQDKLLNTNVVRIPFVVKDDSGVVRQSWPAQGGVPLPRGEVHSTENFRVRDPRGAEVPFQSRILATWPDKSIRWLQVDLQADVAPKGGTGFFLEYGKEIKKPSIGSPLVLEGKDSEYRVVTGPLAFTVSRKNFNLFDEVYIDLNHDQQFTPEERIAHDVPLSVAFRGKTYLSYLDQTAYKIEIEERGPEKIALKASGWFQAQDGHRFCQWVVRIHAFRGKSYVRVFHTFIYTGYPENRYYDRYKDLNLPENETVEEMTIDVSLDLSAATTEANLGIGGSSPINSAGAESFALFQKEYDANEVTRDEGLVGGNVKALGWMDVSDSQKGVTVAIRDFRENFPKAFTFKANPGTLSLSLWPKEAGNLDLKTTADAFGPESRARGSAFGLAKTHELFFYFHQGNGRTPDIAIEAQASQKPLILRVNPYWAEATGALGRLYPVDSKYESQEIVLERLFDWATRQQKDFRWYGMLNYGDTLQWHRHEDEERWYGDEGWHPIGRWGWYNCENVGTHSGALIQFVRSGKSKYFEFGENLARHIMDVDTVHYNTVANDPRLKVLDDEVSQVGSMHRHNGNHWGGRNEEATHTNIYGILLYYYLTGYERAFDVTKEVGGFFLQNRVTYTGHEDSAPHRALANVLWGSVQLYQATWDERYKKNADQMMEIYLAGQNSDGSFYEWYDPISGKWSGEKHTLYMAYYAVRAFIAYHELTQDAEVLAALDKMVRYLRTNPELSLSIMNGFAYLYVVTKNPEYIKMAEGVLSYFVGQSVHSRDSLFDGLIFKKKIYHRPNVYLYSVPWIFGALEESFQRSMAATGGRR